MKKTFFISLTAMMLISSCNKDDDSISGKELVIGTWKMPSVQIVAGKDGSVLKTKVITGCDALQDYIFTPEGTFTFTDYDKTAEDECKLDEGGSTQGKYSYNESSKTMTLSQMDGDNSEAYDIPVLSSTEMRLKIRSNDYDGDGITDFDVLIFNK